MEPIPFTAVLLTEGVLTRDGRMVDPGALTWAVPLTLMAQLTTEDGHDGAIVAGRIDEITRQGADLIATGMLTTDEGIFTVAPMIADLTLRGISVDMAPSIVEYRAQEEAVSPLDPGGPVDENGQPVQQTPSEVAALPPAPVKPDDAAPAPAPADPTTAPEDTTPTDEKQKPNTADLVPVGRESISDLVMAIVQGEIIAATICATPAFAGASIALLTGEALISAGLGCDCGEPSGRDVYRLTSLFAAPDGGVPTAPPAPDAPDASKPDNSGGAMICLRAPEMASLAVDGGTPTDELHITLAFLGDAASLGDDVLAELASICTEVSGQFSAGEGRVAGPAAFVNDPDPDADAGDATVPLVALIDSDWLCDVYHAIDDALDASSIDTPTDHGFIPHMTLQYAAAPSLLDIAQTTFSFGAISLVIGGDEQTFSFGAADSMTASAAGLAPAEPPRSWFTDPDLDGPTPLTVDDEGRVYGHIATWGTCHTGFAGKCVRAPHSHSEYAYFHLGELVTAEGERVDVGQLTLDTTHAGLELSRAQTAAHYEHTGAAIADVRAGEDAHGIWVAGALRADATAGDVRKFRGSKISGDWRSVNGHLELIGALAVNIPGFPVPRTTARVASGLVTALVTAEFDTAAHPFAIDALVAIAEHGDQAIDVIAAELEGVAA